MGAGKRQSAAAVLLLVTANHGQWLPRQSGSDVNGGLNAGLIHFTDSKIKAAEPHTTKNRINLWSLLKLLQHGFVEKALTSTAFSALHLQPDMQRHWFLSLATALDKVRASRSVLPWLPGSPLCVVGHIKAFTEDGQKQGMLARGQKCAQKGLSDKMK